MNHLQTNSGRIFWFAVLAWAAMMLIFSVWSFASATIWGTGDPDMSGPMELVTLIAMVMSLPFAVASFAIMAPLGVLLDRWFVGRTSRVVNMLAGASLALPALAAWLVVGTWLWSPRSLTTNIAGFFSHRHRADQVQLVSALLLGGAIVGMAFRRRRTPPAPRT
jgi:hypothetical protein